MSSLVKKSIGGTSAVGKGGILLNIRVIWRALILPFSLLLGVSFARMLSLYNSSQGVALYSVPWNPLNKISHRKLFLERDNI